MKDMKRVSKMLDILELGLKNKDYNLCNYTIKKFLYVGHDVGFSDKFQNETSLIAEKMVKVIKNSKRITPKNTLLLKPLIQSLRKNFIEESKVK